MNDNVYINKIFNEDCTYTMESMSIDNFMVDTILTSPPYNMTSRKGGHSDTGRYDVYKDWKTEKEYIDEFVITWNIFFLCFWLVMIIAEKKNKKLHFWLTNRL